MRPRTDPPGHIVGAVLDLSAVPVAEGAPVVVAATAELTRCGFGRMAELDDNGTPVWCWERALSPDHPASA